MARCLYCGKSGIFLSLSTNGLCSNCDRVVSLTAGSNFRVFKESYDLIQKTDNPEVVKKRIFLIKRSLSFLYELEMKGINVSTPPPSQMMRTLYEEQDNYYSACFDRSYRKMVIKINSLKQPNAQLANIKIFLSMIDEYVPELINKNSLDIIREKAKVFSTSLQ